MTPLPEVEKDTIIINQGDKEANAFYVLEAGSCDAYVEDESGKSILVKSYGPGSGFGELALLYNQPREGSRSMECSSLSQDLQKVGFWSLRP